nr:uncharacterized protein LOC114079138 isoform X1 [Marmota flaviventris]
MLAGRSACGVFDVCSGIADVCSACAAAGLVAAVVDAGAFPLWSELRAWRPRHPCRGAVVTDSGVGSVRFSPPGTHWRWRRSRRAAKECCSNKFQSKGNPPKGITETSPALQCCDECSMYTDYDSLPPCLCGTNEGL